MMLTKIKDLLDHLVTAVITKINSFFSSISLPHTFPGSLSEFVELVMRPCMSLMSKLSLSTKLLSLFSGFAIAIVILSIFSFIKQAEDRNLAQAELLGVQISRQIMDVVAQTQKHRGLVNLEFSGQKNDAALYKTRAALTAGIDRLDASVIEHSAFELGITWKPIAEELRKLAGGNMAKSSTDSIKQHSGLIAQLMHFSALNNEKSGLLFDPEAGSYLLMDVAIQKIPVWIENLAFLQGIGAGHLKTDTIDFDAKSGIVSRLDALTVALDAVLEMDEVLKRAGETISAERQAAVKMTQNFSVLARQNLLGESINGDASAYFLAGTSAIEKTVVLQVGLQNRLTTLLSARVRTLQLQKNLIFITLLFALVATTYLVFGFYRGFTRSMREVGQSAGAVSSGDLSKHIHIDGSDELAQTGNALEAMNTTLSAIVANVRNDANMVSFLGQKLVTGISDMAIRTEQQAMSLEQTTSSVEELAVTVEKNALSAKAADSLASNVRLIAEAGGESMRAAVDTMGGIHQSAKKMEEIVNMIDRIAFQTDILALNAAVEASHAGEQGRGFAVVASEVRGLAQRSADAARQIRRLIDDSVSRVETGVEQINDVNMTLSDIMSGIRNLAVNTNSISTASAAQSNGLAQISQAIHDMDVITKSNAKMAEEARDSSMDLEQRALTLTKAVSAFKLRQGTADEAYALVQKAVALFRANGISTLQRITENNDGFFADRDMYVFAFDRQGQYVAFAGNASKLDVNLMHVSGLDGKKLVKDAFALPRTGGWVDYVIINPVSQRNETKTSYIELINDDIVLGCGVYKSL